MAAGMANDLLTAVVLATQAPLLLAPAMNVNMWRNPLTQANLGRLLGPAGGDRVRTVGPDRGELACGWIGEGRLIEPVEIVEAAAQMAAAPTASRGGGGRDLAGRRVVITAGPTREPVDDVRFLGNRSSGKMGAALAAAATARGAAVTLIAGPGTPSVPVESGDVRRVEIETATELERALDAALRSGGGADVLVMAAAVADFRPLARVPGKLSRRQSGSAISLPLEPVPDLLAGLGAARGAGKLGRDNRPFLVGFAAEIAGGAALAARAAEKLREKGCDAIVANDVSAPGIGFGADENQVTVFFSDGSRFEIPRDSKRAVAEKLWDILARRLGPAVARGASHA
jgi:phosphopantothenoylcysteine decarboxylase/phosphopantothenate--cysteine ligase